jgi:restriction system protein
MPTVELDEDVWGQLQSLAEPLVDNPNTVLRRLLGLASNSETVAVQPVRRSGRAPVGSLVPESEYELPILSVLKSRGGSAPVRDVVHAVGEMMAERLTERDREQLPNGGERWQNRVQFSRLRMKERGLLKSGSPRGLWELADAGAEQLQAQEIKQ